MKIAVDRNMPLAQEAFATLGEVQVIDGRSLQTKDIRDTTILAIRSTTKVQPNLLDGTDVRFVGTATIGTDHLDIPYLEKQDIKWVYSPGCNARSVAEYITAALLHLAITYNQPLKDQTLGIIGVGNVGSRVAAQAEALGMRVLLNDPPRARTEDSQAFCELSMLLDESDYITMHVPLANDGQDPTFHMVNQTFLARMKPTASFINAARGAIVQTPALVKALQHATIRAAVLDTWEGEPTISPELLELATIATPHIAGHSFEGKVNGTLMVYREACKFLGREPTFDATAFMPVPILPHTTFPTAGSQLEKLNELVRQAYDIMIDDKQFRSVKADPNGFDALRRNYHMRREFACTKVAAIPTPTLRSQVKALGFELA